MQKTKTIYYSALKVSNKRLPAIDDLKRERETQALWFRNPPKPAPYDALLEERRKAACLSARSDVQSVLARIGLA